MGVPHPADRFVLNINHATLTSLAEPHRSLLEVFGRSGRGTQPRFVDDLAGVLRILEGVLGAWSGSAITCNGDGAALADVGLTHAQTQPEHAILYVAETGGYLAR